MLIGGHRMAKSPLRKGQGSGEQDFSAHVSLCIAGQAWISGSPPGQGPGLPASQPHPPQADPAGTVHSVTTATPAGVPLLRAGTGSAWWRMNAGRSEQRGQVAGGRGRSCPPMPLSPLQHFFTSFGARDRCFLLIFRLWQNALLEKTLSPRELWHLVHQCYGSELGLTSEDEDYVCPLQLNGLGSPKEVGDVIALSDIAPTTGAADRSQEPSPVGSRRGRVTPNLSHASSDADHGAEEDKEEPTDSQPDAPSSQTATPLAEPPSTEPTPPNGPASLGPLDLLPSEELLTDTSNSSSSTGEEADLAALLPDLSGRLLINSVFHVGAERLQQMLFSDSPFLQGFLQQCKFTDVTLSPWSGDNKCHQRRVLTYTIPISNPLGPKSASVVETQTLFRRGPQAGGCVVDSEVLTHGIPYQDYFHTAHRYCILGLARNKARLRFLELLPQIPVFTSELSMASAVTVTSAARICGLGQG
uniref:VASt domain-containing protein n=1 Tax=Oryctolagus cuniculus TaxID=9986 RepID=A0A5F9CW91_RABIT